jgi:hypothetical protein
VRLSISDHLSHVNDGKEVRIRRIEHFIPGPVEFLEEEIDLADERLYIVLLDQPIGAVVGPPETIPPPADAGATPRAGGEPLNVPTTDDVESGDERETARQPATPARSAEQTR